MVENFADDLLAQNTRVQRSFHHVQQTLNGAEDLFRQRRRVNPARCHRRLEELIFSNLHQQLLQLKNIDVDANTGQRNGLCREGFTFEG